MVQKKIKIEQNETLSTGFDFKGKDQNGSETIIIIMAFFIICCIFYILESPFHNFLSKYIIVRSEYTMGEQVSKLCLFIIILLSFFSYQALNKPTNIKLSISFFLLGLIMYMSESNMITEKTQPVFGAIGILFTGFFLLRSCSWLSFILFIFSFTMISFGSLTDLIQENEFINMLLPNFLLHFLLITSEERFDMIGITFLCLSAMLCFRIPLWHFIAENKKRSLLMFFSSGIMTIGNGFLHYQYNPSKKLFLIALVMTIIGFLGLMLSCKNLNKKYPRLMMVNEDLFCLFIFFFFVVLPSIHGHQRSSTALLLWLPSMIIMAIYLWRNYLVHYTDVNKIETE